jgi:hypothetical protein
MAKSRMARYSNGREAEARGMDISRISGFSGAVLAVAMTLLILTIDNHPSVSQNIYFLLTPDPMLLEHIRRRGWMKESGGKRKALV